MLSDQESCFDERCTVVREASDELLSFMIAESQTRVEAQVGLMTASDTRAGAMLGVAAALTAAALAVAADKVDDADSHALLWAAVAFSVYTGIAALLAVWALWPCPIDIPGWDPDSFDGDIRSRKDWSGIQVELVVLLQNRLHRNDRVMLDLAWRSRLAMVFLACSPVAGAAALAFSQRVQWLGLAFALLAVAIPSFSIGRRRQALQTLERHQDV